MAPVLFAAVALIVGSLLPQQAPPRDPVRPPTAQPAPSTATPETKAKILELRSQAAQRRAAGDFDGAIAALEAAAEQDPSNPAGHQLVAEYYWERAQKDTALGPIQRGTYINQGIAATDRALSLNPDYVQSLAYKNILLRMQANGESDPEAKARLIAEADALRTRALELNRSGAPGMGTVAPAVMTPRQVAPVDGMMPVRVGGSISVPTRTMNVRPIYPADALAARVQGVVIIEATIDTAGKVRNAVVLRSIPLLDQAAIDAVNQWEFEPTLLNGAPVPVIMTVTVNFTIGS